MESFGLAWAYKILDYTLTPSDTGHLTVYYLFWIVLFVSVNTIWDIRTKKTPTFHLAKLREKADVLHHAATFCSSLLIITALISPAVGHLATETAIPMILAGGSGILRAIPALCPYEAQASLIEGPK